LLDVGLDIFESEVGFGDGGQAGDPVRDGELGDDLCGGHHGGSVRDCGDREIIARSTEVKR